MDSAGIRKTRRPLVAGGATAGRQHGCPFDTLISPGPWTCRPDAGVQDGERASSRYRQGVEIPDRPARTALIASGAARTALISPSDPLAASENGPFRVL